jgi:hypothetical protein
VRESDELRRVLDPGTYMLVVEGEESFDAGPYLLALEFTASPPLEGESCEDALPLTPSGVQRVTGSADGFADDIDTSCTDIPSSDRVYTFTLAAQRTLRFTVQGDSQAYAALGTSCAADASAVCLPLRATPRAQNRTLDPGTYFLVIDADESAGGAYEITIDFDSEPLGESCSDALPLAIGEAPVTVTGAGHASSASRDLYYGFTLTRPSHLELDAEAPGKLWVTRELDTIYRSGGKLATDVPPGKYCVHVSGPLAGAALELTALAAPLAAPGGRGCDDAIPLSASGGHALYGYASFGRLTQCSVFPAQLYAFELTETTRVRASASSGFALAVFRDEACSELARCSGGSSSLDASLAPGDYKLAVAGPPFVGYDLKLGFDCDPAECAVVEPPIEDGGFDGGEPEPPDAGVIPPDSSVPEPDAMTGEPTPDSGSDGPDASDDGGPVVDAELEPDAAAPAERADSSGCACRTVAPRRGPRPALRWLGLLVLACVAARTARTRTPKTAPK